MKMFGFVNQLRNNKALKVFLWGLIIHFLLLFACFDLYFSSPLEHGMTPIKSIENPPAKRLVLFVADGLRAEAIFGENQEDRTPFLSNVRKYNSSWGISHTRVPTESRPGHVAMLAGIFEDPSAIMKGWKANPVEFDSVVNQSTHAWCWGSPDIVPVFYKYSAKMHIKIFPYDSNMEDFGKKNSSLLDQWVFDRVENFLNKIPNCKHSCDEYHTDGNFFFLHLLGIDTAGHGFKPHSKEYIDNIKMVDDNVRKMVELFDKVYNDKNTAYVFTSDHGMTDWGSHGAGTTHETEAPIIAWGAGIKTTSKQQDIKQIDIAPMLSSLIGINIPINSLGVVPLNYFNVDERSSANILLSNTLQLYEIFKLKMIRTEQNAIIFIPFKQITSAALNDKLEYIQKLFQHGQYNDMKENCEVLIEVLIDGLNYYQNYYQKVILISITIGLLAWIFYLALCIIQTDQSSRRRQQQNSYTFYVMLCVIIYLCFKQNFPFSYYLYFIFPIVIFHIDSCEQSAMKTLINQIKHSNFKSIAFHSIFYLIGIELLVLGFFYRFSYTFLMLLIGLSIIIADSLKTNTNMFEKLAWLICCIVLSIFPTLPVMKTSMNVPIYVVGTLIWIIWLIIFFNLYLNRLERPFRTKHLKNEYLVFMLQFICLLLSSIYVLLLEYGVISEESNIKYVSWFLMVIPIILLPLTSKVIMVRLMATFFAFAPFYLLVSPNFEVLFSAFYVAMLFLWLVIESKTFESSLTKSIYYSTFDTYRTNNHFHTESFRRAFLFIVFIFVGFFGCGNIASLNSFDPMWVRAFLTVFSPFKMMGLILLKLMVPFIFTCCAFRAINSVGKENILSIFCIVLMFSDIMVLQFLYLVTNVGSWLDIGTSLSHFIIMEAFVIILLLLYGLAHLLTTVKYVRVY